MDKECITIEPEIVLFGPEPKQLIKVINRTAEPIENCFFCLFNTNKFQFSPDSFTLEPREHKLITITLKLKIADWPNKEFAYLKSKSFNKRLTLMSNQQGSAGEQRNRSNQEGVQEINTLTSRDYKEAQRLAYEKIIAQKEAYILKLERKLEQTSYSAEKQKQQAFTMNNKFYIDEIQTLQLQVAILAKQKEQVVIENMELHARFKEYRVSMEADGRLTQLTAKLNEANREIKSQTEEIKFLELQCQQFLTKIQQKEAQIKQNQFVYASKIDGIIKEGQKKLQEMETKIHKERKHTEKVLQSESNQKIVKLQQKLKTLETDLSKKQKQLKTVTTKLSKQETKTKQLIEETKEASKAQKDKEKLIEKNKQLKEKLSMLEKSNQQLKQEVIVCRNKLSGKEDSVTKMHRYLEMALESSKNQNQILKKSKQDLENQLSQEGKSRRFYENKAQGLEQNLRDMSVQLKQIQEQKDKIQAEKLAQKEQAHDKIMQLKSQNINLIEKIGVQRRRQTERNLQLEQLRETIPKYQKQLERTRHQYIKLESEHHDTLQQKQKIEKKIEKYRKEAKKSIKSISDNAKDQLHRIEEQKNKLTKKVQELEISALNTELGTNPDVRHKTRTQYEEATKAIVNSRQKHPMSVEENRKTGIKNQRRQLQESQANSRTEIDLDKIYGQLGQLREFKNYVNNQIRKLGSLVGVNFKDYDQNAHMTGNSIFSAINFFKQLEDRLQNKLIGQEKLIESQKQTEFLRGRLAQIQPILKVLKAKERKPEQISLNKSQFDRNAVEYIREEMKNQYRKLFDSLKLSEEKYEVLRKKIYEEYRARIIDLISKKDRDEYTVAKIQAVLQRFVQGLSNTSHKEAVLAKEVKLKQEARKEASLYKQKLNALVKQMESVNSKKGGNICAREPVRLFEIQNDNQWLDAVRLEAKALTFEAQNARLLADKDLYMAKTIEISDQLKMCQADLETKEGEIQRLKKEVIKISKQHENQLQKQEQQLNSYRKKFEKMQKMQKQISDLAIKEKENNHLRDQLQEKRQMLKNLRQREKMLEQLLDQSKRNQSTIRDKDRKEYIQESRMQESLRDLKDNNRQLRADNARLKQQVDGLVEEVNKKNAALKRLKTETEEHRIKASKGEADSIEKLRNQVRELKEEQRKAKEQNDKYKRKKDREISQLQSDKDRLKSQFQIEKSSLESIIRALCDSIKGIYCSLNIMARKKGKIVGEEPNFDAVVANPSDIRTTKIRQIFDDIIQALKQ